MMKFNDLEISEALKQSLAKQNLVTMTEVQEKSMGLIMSGQDLIVRSKTGSGKTLAFLIPLMERINNSQALILAPTRELAQQIHKEVMKLDRRVRAVSLYGGIGINPQISQIRRGVDIIVGTPGRILDLMSRGELKLDKINYVVIDEADRMFDMGFVDDMDKILRQAKNKKQTLLFSATMPGEVRKLSNRYMTNPQELMLQQDEVTVKNIDQQFFGVDRKIKLNFLAKLLKQHKTDKTIIFCNTKRWAESLSRILVKKGFRAKAIHSDLSQAKRSYVIEEFKRNSFNVLVATDVAARGLHIDSVSHVFNYDLPRNPKDYVHRIGRTGRAGAKGIAISLLTNMDMPLLNNVEREIQQRVRVQSVKDDGSYEELPQQKVQAIAQEAVQTQNAVEASVWDKMD